MNSKVSQEIAIPYTEVLELRQKNLNANVAADGDYLVNLEEQIILNEGDTIGIKSIFLDTAKADSSLISLKPNRIDENDVIVDDPSGTTSTMRISVGKYLTNVPTTFESTNYTTAAKVLDASKPIVYSKVFSPTFLGVSADVAKDKNLSTLGADTEPYLMCEQKGTTDGTKSTSLIESFLVTIQNDHNGDLGDLAGNRITATFSFVAAGDLSADPKIHTSTFIINADKANYKDAYAALVSKFFNGTLTVTKELLEDETIHPLLSTGTFSFGTPVNAEKPITAKVVAASAQYSRLYLSGIETAATPDGTMSLDPVIEQVVITLPAGSYSSDEIARRITEEASRIDGNGAIPDDDGLNSVVYSSIRQELKRLNPTFAPNVGDTYAACNITRPIVFAKPYVAPTDTSTKMFRLNSLKPADKDYYVGSSNGFVLEYDSQAEKFSITSMHSPLRDVDPASASRGAEQVRAYQSEFSPAAGATQAVNVNRWANKYSGIFITKLEPESLWNDQMKFPTDITTKLTADNGTVLINGTQFLFHGGLAKLVDGVNITGTFNGVSSSEIKTVTPDTAAAPNTLVDAASGDFEIPPTVPPRVDANDPVNYYAVNVSAGIPIFGGSQIDGVVQNAEEEGYYRIEIDSKIRTNVYGGDRTTPSLSAIISKYYSQGSFTTSYNEGSVSYTHYGQPLTLTDFRVRVLLPNGDLAKDVSDRNCVFMEVSKTRTLMPQ